MKKLASKSVIPMMWRMSGVKYPNMKELRFDADGGVWRFGALQKAEEIVR
jgi:hypothetical protein